MLTVLIYIQETVYYSTNTFDLLIMYGLELINWKEFDFIKEIIADDNALGALEIDNQEYM